MSTYNRKILKSGDYCYFFTSSITAPHILFRMCGEIVKTIITEDNISYRIKLNKVLESNSFLQDNINGLFFKLLSSGKQYTNNKQIFVYGLKSPKDELKKSLKGFDFHIDHVYVSKVRKEMEAQFIDSNIHIKDKLKSYLDFINTRTI